MINFTFHSKQDGSGFVAPPPTPASLDGVVYSFAYNSTTNTLYVGGSFETPFQKIMMLSGSIWSGLGAGLTNGPKTPTVRSITLSKNLVYAA